MTKLTEYNPFDHLLGADELSQYLTDAYEDSDPGARRKQAVQYLCLYSLRLLLVKSN